MNLRERDEKRIIKIGVIDRFSNGKENAIRPFPMSGHFNKSWEDHPDNVIKVIRKYLPNAEIYLVPNTEVGIKYLIEKECTLVNVSLAGYTESVKYNELANKTFLVVSAGNRGDKGESWLAIQDYSCAVGAVDKYLKPMYYSSYGEKAVKTVAIEPVIDGKILHGTSFTGPVVIGLLGQWFKWYENLFKCNPSISEANEFVKVNSADIFEDGEDLRTGYGLLRLPKKFKATEVIVRTGNILATKVKHVEGEQPIDSQVDLLVTPFMHENRTMVGSNGLTSALGINVHWDKENFVSKYIR